MAALTAEPVGAGKRDEPQALYVRRGPLQAPPSLNRLTDVPASEDHSPGLRPIARYAPDDTDLDAIACVTEDHLVIYVTGLIEGRREVVGLEILQLPESLDSEAVVPRLRAAVEGVRQGSRRPVSAELMRRMPVSPALEFRQEDAMGALVSRVREVVQLVAAKAYGDRRQAQQASYLADVVAYVSAIRERLSPAAVIAEARGVSVSSANSRIARSRMFGLLTSTGKSVAAGEATDEAIALLRDLGIELQQGGEVE